MTVNVSRSQNAELAEGMSDGTFKKIALDKNATPNSDATWASRKDMSPLFHGFTELDQKVLGDGTVHTTPSYIATPSHSAATAAHSLYF